jgi:hypothetical protein
MAFHVHDYLVADCFKRNATTFDIRYRQCATFFSLYLSISEDIPSMLYDDLSPAAGEPVKAPKLATSTSNPYTALFGSNVAEIEGNKKEKEETVRQLTKSTSKAPTTLLFKPRQTAIPASKPLPISTVRHHAATKAGVIVEQVSSSSQEVPQEEAELRGHEEFNIHDSWEVSDAYDPRRPNDYIEYCQERLETKRLIKLEEQNRQRLEEQERARSLLEAERRQAAESKDFQKLIGLEASASNNTPGGGAVGRGRGRGALNLPAWITQQMELPAPGNNHPEQFQDSSTVTKSGNKEEAQATTGVKRKASALSKPSCVLLLQNMLSLEAALEDRAEARAGGAGGLGAETQDECEKYGPVLSCEVFLAERGAYPSCPEEGRVRAFVQFARQDAAARAFKELHGRFFGGRQVSASFYDEQLFAKRQLAPGSSDES